jgi:hypothetical protein
MEPTLFCDKVKNIIILLNNFQPKTFEFFELLKF